MIYKILCEVSGVIIEKDRFFSIYWHPSWRHPMGVEGDVIPDMNVDEYFLSDPERAGGVQYGTSNKFIRVFQDGRQLNYLGQRKDHNGHTVIEITKGSLMLGPGRVTVWSGLRQVANKINDTSR